VGVFDVPGELKGQPRVPTYDTIIRNGTVVREHGLELADVAIADGKFIEIGPQLHGDARETIDARGLHVFSGVIDPHVHFNEPGRTEWEGFATGSAALAAGGGTCFFDMPLNSSPPVLDGESFDLKLAAAKAKSVTDFALWGGLTPNNLDKLEELAERGVIGFKAFMCDSGIDEFPRSDHWTLHQGMEKAAQLGLPVAVHAEDQELIDGRTLEARTLPSHAAASWLASRTPLAEIVAIQAALLMAQGSKCSLHVVHVSTIFGVNSVSEFRSAGVDVTCETCPHYLLLNVHDAHHVGTAAKCAPPIRIDANREMLWQAVIDNKFDLIASDHSPAPPSMKGTGDFFKDWGGVAGVQSTLPALLTCRPELPLQMIGALTSGKVARRFRLRGKGEIAVGFDADLTLVDTEAQYVLRRDDLLDRHKLSPYVGRTFHGLVRRTLVRGSTVFLDGKIVSKPIGQLVKPA